MYAVTLLRQLFRAINLPTFRPMTTGGVLWCGTQEYCFRGIPEFVVHKHVQRRPHVGVYRCDPVHQSIYGIDALLTTFECDAPDSSIVCITLFKKKSATLYVARVTQEVDSAVDNVAGSMTLKYIVLDNTTSLKYFALHMFTHKLP